MADPVDLSDRIAALAAKPASVETNGLKATEQKLSDVILADLYLQRKAAAANKLGGVRFSKIVAPGPT